MTHSRRPLLAVLAATAIGASGWCHPLGAQGATPAGAAREQLALAYLRLEGAWRDHHPTGEAVASINRAFDAATLAFFGGRYAEATARIDSLTRTLEPSEARWTAMGDSLQRVMAAMPSERKLMTVDGVEVAYRRWLPASRNKAPVFIALHGAGGDEHMFVEAYGAGRLRTLAQGAGAVIISPATTAWTRAPAAFDSLLAAIEREHPIDRRRVMVIGHSMGAGAAWRLALQQRGRISAVACLAGGLGSLPAGASADSLPPLLVVGGAIDPIANADRLEQGATAARAAGVRVTFQRRAGYGHTLLVGDALPEVVRWLLAPSPDR